MDENNSSKQSTNSDYFILIGGFAIILVLAVASIRWVPQATTITSFACGMLAAIIIYRFLGGFSKEDSFAVGGIKVTGALCALLATYITVNTSLEHQINELYSIPSNNQQLLVMDGNGILQNLEVKVKNRDDITPITIKPDKEQLYKFVEICLNEPGICIPEPKPVDIIVKKELNRGEGVVCGNQSKYSGLPISLRKGIKNFVSVRIKQNKDACDDSKAPLRLKISRADNEDLNRFSTRETPTYQLGPFRNPTDEPIDKPVKSGKTTCSA